MGKKPHNAILRAVLGSLCRDDRCITLKVISFIFAIALATIGVKIASNITGKSPIVILSAAIFMIIWITLGVIVIYTSAERILREFHKTINEDEVAKDEG